MRHRLLGQIALAVVALAAMVAQSIPAAAGTTGTLTGTALDTTTKAPIAGAKISVASPSQIASTTTDATGHFVFLALAPDTYSVSLEANGYESTTLGGVTIVADQARVISLTAVKALKQIGRVTARAATALVKPGTTADVYAVNAVQQEKFQGIGGGGQLNNAYSAVATVPGAFVPQGIQGGNGITPNVYIRGGDYDQIGFELDGIPINRSFDNYPSGPGATLGQQELEVYTGANPANSEGQGLAGFINQVIRTGTYPGFVSADIGIGTPTFYHKAAFEFGGATVNRNLTYYVGVDGYDQDYRYYDQFNGASVSQAYGVPLSPCPGSGISPSQVPSCFGPGGKNYTAGVFLPISAFALGGNQVPLQSHLAVRDSVANVHIGIPRKSGLKDDIQVLGVINYVSSQYYNSTNDQGGPSYLNAIGLGVPFFIDGFQYAGAPGVKLPSNYAALTSVYNYPLPHDTSQFDPVIPYNQRDAGSNNQGIFKIQYTHMFSTNALMKLYGYTYYSNWLFIDPQSAYADFVALGSPDYELSSHTRGLSLTFNDQLASQHLLQFQGSYTTSNTTRDNNTQMFNGFYSPNTVNARTVLAAMVDASNPYNGLCYAQPGPSGPSNQAVPTTCRFGGGAQFASIGEAFCASHPNMTAAGCTPSTNIPTIPSGLQCGSGPCAYYTVANGLYATYNTVKPQFYAISLTDQWKPSDRWSIDGGVRLDSFGFVGSNTQSSPARAFWYRAFNMDNCVDSANNLIAKQPLDACPSGTHPINVTNPAGQPTQTYNEWQPRIAATYQTDPTTVLRASYGRYTEAPNSAFQQYDTLQQNAPYQLYSVYGFQKFGFTTPMHYVAPPTSNNLDFSLEHQFPNDYSVKLTPFLRKTQNQIQQFYLNQATSFVSGLNVGQQTAEGFELEVDKGNFAQNGLAGKLAFTYTNSYIKYQPLSNGSNIIAPINATIQQYNAYTSYCSSHPKSGLCGSTYSGVVAAPCYTAGSNTSSGSSNSTPGEPRGIPGTGPCTKADIANPYWNAPPQGLLDPNGNYATFDVFPAGIGSSVSGYGAPYFAALILQYKKDKWAVTPALTFNAGQRYGAPESTFGVVPEFCSATLPGNPANDPRYTYGAHGGSPYDAGTCASFGGNTLSIPDPYTKRFDTIGAFVAPSQLQMSLQLSYQATKSAALIANFTNLVNSCFGGTKVPFTVANACGYGVVGGGTAGDVGNLYNPGAAIQPLVNTPYAPVYGLYPFNFFLSVRVRT